MGRTSQRSSEQTRALILDATSSSIARRGISVSLDEIAEIAGLTKGGVIYHYGSKLALFLAAARSQLADVADAIEEHSDSGDTEPGSFLRAYVRASFSDRWSADEIRELATVTSHLHAVPEVAELYREFHERWEALISADGLPASVVLLVLTAVEGATSTPEWGGALTPEERGELRDQLLFLTRNPARLAP